MSNAISNIDNPEKKAGRKTISVENIPDELKQRPQWVVWKWETRDGKRTKVLRNPSTGTYGSSTAPDTWAPFNVAYSAYQSHTPYAGIGYVFSADDPYTGVDIDHCVTDGVIDRPAESIIRALATYSEISPSGTGVKMIVKATKKGKRCKNTEREIEIYNQGRFFTVTGDKLDSAPTTIAEAQAALDTLYDDNFPEPEIEHVHHEPQPNTLEDDELLQVMYRSKSGDKIKALWNDDEATIRELYGHYDHSSLDQSLCNHLAFYCGGDPERIDRMFRASALMRDKWERDSYRTGTIERAISGCEGEFYKPPKEPEQEENVSLIDAGMKDLGPPVTFTELDCGNDLAGGENVEPHEPAPTTTSETTGTNEIKKVDEWEKHNIRCATYDELLALAKSTVQDWVIPGFLPAGYCQILSADPKAGKSTAAYWLAVSLIHGDLIFGEFTAGNIPVLFYDFENPLTYATGHLKTFQRGRSSEPLNTYFNYRSPSFVAPDASCLDPVLNVAKLEDEIKYLERRHGKKGVFMLDTMRAAFMAKEGLKPGWENDAGQMSVLIRPLAALAHRTGWAFILLHHNNRNGTISGSAEIKAAVDIIATMTIRDALTRKIEMVGRYSLGGTPDSFLIEYNKSTHTYDYGRCN